MVIPLRDRNPTTRFAGVTLLVIAVCVVVYFVVQPSGQGTLVQRTDEEQAEELTWTLRNAMIPCELRQGRPLTIEEVRRTFVDGDQSACDPDAGGPELDPGKDVYLAVLVSMFLHGGLLHLGGNLLFLWVFGNNIEDRMGHVGYAAFYLAGGAVAALAHAVVDLDSTVPVVGASGAVAAVMGAYLVLFPNAPVLSVIPIFFFGMLAEISAKWLLAVWFVSQFLLGPNSGVAWAAHVAGFLFGIAVALLLRRHLLRAEPAWID